jgi:CRP/FNR family transcriptional regulator, cyclic AMP receptor protein
MFRQEYADFSIFAGLNGDQIGQLLPYMVECHFGKDEVIFQQGQSADCLYVLLSGEVTIRYKPYDGPPITVARIEPGGVFGWSAALGRDVYTSGAVAVQESIAYRLRGSNLPVLCEEYPETGMILLDRLAGVITERLNNTHTQILGILSQGIDVYSESLGRMTKNGRK